MDTPLCNLDRPPSLSDAKLTPFAQESVTLRKQEYIQLVWDARYWKSAHQRAIARMQQLEVDHRLTMEQAALREAVAREELEHALAKVRDLQKRLFGRKSETSSYVDQSKAPNAESTRPRGQQPGAAGHGRTTHAHLPARVEDIEIDMPQCPTCGLGFADFPGTEDSEVLEIEVKAYRRVIRRRRYRKTCQCDGVAGIVAAPPTARLIARGKYGISVWVHLLLSKFLYGQPSHRLLQDLSDSGLNLSEGTLTGGLEAIAPLFAPVEEALLVRLRSETHWHADETRWVVYADVEGKIGHRWYLWVFQSKSVIHYVLDPTRSANVPIAELGEAQGGIVSCDRYSAYKKFVRLHPTFELAFCWTHQRRDFLELANSYPDLSAWAFVWVDKIGELYRLNKERLAAPPDSARWVECDSALRHAVGKMALDRDTEIKDSSLTEPAVKVLQSMQNHWAGLTVFVDHLEVLLDNNNAERSVRTPVVGRKNFHGSGSQWAGELAATMYSLLMTVKLWGINPRTWLTTYLHACAANGNQAPADLNAFLPWTMDARQLTTMKSVFVEPDHAHQKGLDTS
jgi:transposase